MNTGSPFGGSDCAASAVATAVVGILSAGGNGAGTLVAFRGRKYSSRTPALRLRILMPAREAPVAPNMELIAVLDVPAAVAVADVNHAVTDGATYVSAVPSTPKEAAMDGAASPPV